VLKNQIQVFGIIFVLVVVYSCTSLVPTKEISQEEVKQTIAKIEKKKVQSVSRQTITEEARVKAGEEAKTRARIRAEEEAKVRARIRAEEEAKARAGAKIRAEEEARVRARRIKAEKEAKARTKAEKETKAKVEEKADNYLFSNLILDNMYHIPPSRYKGLLRYHFRNGEYLVKVSKTCGGNIKAKASRLASDVGRWCNGSLLDTSSCSSFIESVRRNYLDYCE
jgi:hypothetical protein